SGEHLIRSLERFMSRPGDGSFPQVSGIRFKAKWTDQGARIEPNSVTINGEPLDPTRTYTVATLDFIINSAPKDHPLQNRTSETTDPKKLLIREIVEQFLENPENHKFFETDGRIEFLSQ